MHARAGGRLRLDANALDYAMLVICFAAVLGIGFAARRQTALGFFVAGRSLPAGVSSRDLTSGLRAARWSGRVLAPGTLVRPGPGAAWRRAPPSMPAL